MFGDVGLRHSRDAWNFTRAKRYPTATRPDSTRTTADSDATIVSISGERPWRDKCSGLNY